MPDKGSLPECVTKIATESLESFRKGAEPFVPIPMLAGCAAGCIVGFAEQAWLVEHRQPGRQHPSPLRAGY